MKLVSFGADGALGILVGERVADAAKTYAASRSDGGDAHLRTMNTLVNGGADALNAARHTEQVASSSPNKAVWTTEPIIAPVPSPPKLLCLAGNYAEHIREGGGVALEREKTTPRVFMKPPSTTIIGHGDAIIKPKNVGWLDWEAEFAIVIGKRAKNVSDADALDCVFGYTIVNDVSERKLVVPESREDRDGDKWFDWLNGKWGDTFAPMGPCVVTKDEIADPDALALKLSVNGIEKQKSDTGKMIFDTAGIVAWCSRLMTLEPGDVIATGTPDGVGRARGEWLNHGDVVDITIEGIGTLSNPVIDEA